VRRSDAYSEEFINVIQLVVRDTAVEGTLENMMDPPGRKPTENLLAIFASNAREFSSVTNASQVSYLGLTSNSNSYAFTFVESLGFARPTPQVWAPGYNNGTPSPSLSYPVPQ
jgi:hypothetical protein